MKPSVSRLVIDSSLAVIVGAALVRWIGPDYDVSPLALEWAEVLLEILGPVVLVLAIVRHVRGTPTADRLAARLTLLAATLLLLGAAGELGTP